MRNSGKKQDEYQHNLSVEFKQKPNHELRNARAFKGDDLNKWPVTYSLGIRPIRNCITDFSSPKEESYRLQP